MKRVFLIITDSLGIGELPDARIWKDEGSNTLRSIRASRFFSSPCLKELGLFNIDTVGGGIENPKASFARLGEISNGKDTTIGHWEICGIISDRALPTYPNGFPDSVIEEFEKRTGRGVLCNKPYSGTDVIRDYGEEHIRTGKLIVYTSQDSVFQIAAHEDYVPIKELYKYCQIAREIMTGEHSIGRIIARPFVGDKNSGFTRTTNRHDFSLAPQKRTMLDLLKDEGLSVISVGKIYDIFAGVGITESYRTISNRDGMDKSIALLEKDFNGLCFVNLVDFDSKYGHRNDIDGYARALSEFDSALDEFIKKMREGDMLIVTADHGCDPLTPSTDHSREYVPMLVYGEKVKSGVNLGTRSSFADISATILEYFGVEKEETAGASFLQDILK